MARMSPPTTNAQATTPASIFTLAIVVADTNL